MYQRGLGCKDNNKCTEALFEVRICEEENVSTLKK